MARTFTISGRRFALDHDAVEARLEAELPEPIRDHFVVVGGRRFPPKQVLRMVTGLDLADFTTHQARRVLTRLGFVAGRESDRKPVAGPRDPDPRWPHGGRQAEALRPHAGQWVALGKADEVLVADATPELVLAWLAAHERTASGMFRVPEDTRSAEGVAPL
jgi:hypothetical protein